MSRGSLEQFSHRGDVDEDSRTVGPRASIGDSIEHACRIRKKSRPFVESAEPS